MAQMQELRQAVDNIAGRPGPMLSVYLNVNPAVPENQERAYLTRLKDDLGSREIPEELKSRVYESVRYLRPGSRTLAIFADEEGFVEIYRVQIDLPQSARYGEPNVSPLFLALDEQEPYGAAVVDAESFRYFVVSLLEGSGEDPDAGGTGYREVEVDPSSPEPRGSTDHESDSRRAEANISRFYNELGKLTRDVTFREGVKRLILAGPKERTAEFRERLPQDVAERVVAEEPVDLGAPEGEILERLEAAREKAEEERGRELLDEIRESGVWGIDTTITALQEENRVYHLAMLWELDGEIRWCDNDGLAITDIAAEECPYCGQPTRVRPLADVLVDLAAARGARVAFFRGENDRTDTLRDEFEGLAGLTRF
ncbi:MAG: VLRF1 family aeRF1-type release factor [Rubrobacteraceae bacterium]